MNKLEKGYYWCHTKSNPVWKICQVGDGYVHFFGEVSQELDNYFLTEYVTFGDRIVHSASEPKLPSL